MYSRRQKHLAIYKNQIRNAQKNLIRKKKIKTGSANHYWKYIKVNLRKRER